MAKEKKGTPVVLLVFLLCELCLLRRGGGGGERSPLFPFLLSPRTKSTAGKGGEEKKRKRKKGGIGPQLPETTYHLCPQIALFGVERGRGRRRGGKEGNGSKTSASRSPSGKYKKKGKKKERLLSLHLVMSLYLGLVHRPFSTHGRGGGGGRKKKGGKRKKRWVLSWRASSAASPSESFDKKEGRKKRGGRRKRGEKEEKSRIALSPSSFCFRTPQYERQRLPDQLKKRGGRGLKKKGKEPLLSVPFATSTVPSSPHRMG